MLTTVSVAKRLLSRVAVLEGPGNPDALENISAGSLPSGTLCFVEAEQSIYAFNKNSTATVNPPLVIPTVQGAGVPGRWTRAGGESTVPYRTLFWCNADSEVANPNGSIARPFLTIQEALDMIGTGGGTILCAPGTYPGFTTPENCVVNIIGLAGAQGAPGANVTIGAMILLDDGAIRIESCSLDGNITVRGSGSVFVKNLAFHQFDIIQDGAGGWVVGIVSDGLEPGEVGSVQCLALISKNTLYLSPISVSGGQAVVLQCDLQEDLTFTGSPGTFITDLETLNRMAVQGAGANNATIEALDVPTLATSITAPSAVGAGISYVDVAFAGSIPGDTFAISYTKAELAAGTMLGAPTCTTPGNVSIPVLAFAANAGANVHIRLSRIKAALV